MILLELFFTFLKIGAFAFGGGYGMIPVMKQEVLLKGWLTESQFLDIVGISESTPGPIAVNMSTYIGTEIAGVLGAIICTFAVVLPAFLIIYFVAKVLEKFANNKYVSAFLDGIKPVVIGFILAVGITLLLKVLSIVVVDPVGFGSVDLKGVIIAVVITCIIAIPKYVFKKKTPPIITIISSALLGIIAYGLF